MKKAYIFVALLLTSLSSLIYAADLVEPKSPCFQLGSLHWHIFEKNHDEVHVLFNEYGFERESKGW